MAARFRAGETDSTEQLLCRVPRHDRGSRDKYAVTENTFQEMREPVGFHGSLRLASSVAAFLPGRRSSFSAQFVFVVRRAGSFIRGVHFNNRIRQNSDLDWMSEGWRLRGFQAGFIPSCGDIQVNKTPSVNRFDYAAGDQLSADTHDPQC